MLSLLDRRTLSPPAYLQLAPVQPPAPRGEATLSVSLAIATQRRPEGLAKAVRSTFRQTGVQLSGLELVVVDNDAVPSAKAVIDALAAEAPFPVRYVHEPAPGVANARNAAMAAASGELIAFLDDDEEAAPGWLAALIDVQRRFDADVVFGPVHARAPASVVRHREYLQRFFSREGPGRGRRHRPLLRLRRQPRPPRRAAASDRAVLAGAQRDRRRGRPPVRRHAAGRRAVRLGPEALVYEDPIPARLTLKYALARAFAYGQGPTYGCATADPPDWRGVARFMTTGTMQAGVFGLIAGFQWLTRAPHRAFALDRAVRGAGKVLFAGPFAMKFYGHG